MTTRQANLLLDDDAQPANGVTTAAALMWYGGELSLTLAGVPAGASVQLVMSVNMPPGGVIPDDPTDWLEDADWIPLGTAMTAKGRQDYGNVNLCMLAVLVANTAANTRLKALIS